MNSQETYAKARQLIAQLRAIAEESDRAMPDCSIDDAAFVLLTTEIRDAVEHFEAFFPPGLRVARNLKVINGGNP